MKVLLVDDEKTIRVTLGDDLRRAGHEVAVAENLREARSVLASEAVDAVVTDLRLPDGDGLELLPDVREKSPGAEVLVITGHGSVESAVAAMKAGAADYLLKPFYNEEVLLRLGKVARVRALEDENRRLREALGGEARFERLVGGCPAMQKVFRLIEQVAGTDATVLVEGESGTGKELVAEAIHRRSPRRDKPLVAVSCAALPETLLASELFGHEKGAFTDAIRERAGRFEQADGGTLFLDDVDDIPAAIQVKLLRVLQEREFERVGGTKTLKVDIRVVAATKKSLRAAVEAKAFREDLFYRLNVVNVTLPSLRERREDIPVLAAHFLVKHGKGGAYVLSAESRRRMMEYPWPGNVRELEHAIERAIVLAGPPDVPGKPAVITLDFPAAVPAAPGTAAAGGVPSLADAVARAETEVIRAALARAGDSRTKAADLLGISRKNLWEKMKKYGMEGNLPEEG
ncbi:MAG: sigma-54 dependent transcriptional regulator [Planctomycetota bacterium]